MNIPSRLGDYGIIGSFFVLIQVVILTSLFPVEVYSKFETILGQLNVILPSSSAIATPFATLLATIAFILVFFLGLAIDLLGFIVPSLAVTRLRDLLKHHAEWLEPELAEHTHFVKEDAIALIESPNRKSFWMKWIEVLTTVPFSSKYRRILEENQVWWSLRKPSNRLFSFMVSLAQRTGHPENVKVLTEQLHVWRLSGAISTVLAIASLEVFVLGSITIPSATSHYSMERTMIVVQIGYLLCFFLSFGIARRAFVQVSDTLFYCLYLRPGAPSKTTIYLPNVKA